MNATKTEAALTAYISKSRDREMTTTWEASICNDAEESEITALSDYTREGLIAEVLKTYPGIKIEDA